MKTKVLKIKTTLIITNKDQQRGMDKDWRIENI